MRNNDTSYTNVNCQCLSIENVNSWVLTRTQNRHDFLVCDLLKGFASWIWRDKYKPHGRG